MDLPLRTAVSTSPDLLRFDTDNPRLTAQFGLKKGASDFDVIMALKNVADIDELLLSIASNGYIMIEPMIVIGEKAPYLVLEGNRRLAAIKLLKNKDLAKKCRITIPEISINLDEQLNEVLVYRVAAESEARAFIGFKHINGPHKWDSLAKAKYASEWYREGKSVEEISSFIGDSFATVKKMLHGWIVLEQAEENGLFTIDDRYPTRQFAFSHLYVALTRNQIREYLGLNPSFSRTDIDGALISQEKLPELKKLLIWLYGSSKDKIKPVVSSQNPDVKNLAEVLADQKATSMLERSNDLYLSHAELTPAEQIFEKALYRAESSAKQALGNVYSYAGGKSLYETAIDLSRITKQLTANMKMKQDNIEIDED
ncbi:hypothetical protein DSCA_30350 [Desulfosarcina alkanivorans]|uniref:Uncharacterized protein n=1 Tax=Desulfosarcina alkanivorans TaxID=571177 RepID=A0A5K7YL15_9BACT|nr:ParB N-terminal domain-containing protein [Desulfosarcina alkanivorans]BBO69105.1 hypothetical protein DSCA_30350 [Desulfosarcina alkanivorans]